MLSFDQNESGRTLLAQGGREVFVNCTAADAKYIGRQLNMMEQWKDGSWHLVGNIFDAARLIEYVLDTPEGNIPKIRGQIEDAGGETETLSDLDCCIMDVKVREAIADAARDIDNPFRAESDGKWVMAKEWVKVPVPDLQDLFDGYVGEDAIEEVSA